MSMFDWKAKKWSAVASTRLWPYWVVSIPLTLVIMAIWWTWLVRHLSENFRQNSS
ncbi:hypothetical protein B0O99DRAFT_618648 [Bisporella sp. PMI_857]|nr:hypothetical protein B0O99DRAFT_618648 [Bisporella sp. PMI_857]